MFMPTSGIAGSGFTIPHRRPVHGQLTPEQRVENRERSAIRNAVERGIAHIKILQVLRTGIRTRSPRRERVIVDTIAVAIGLVIYRQDRGDLGR